MKLEEGVCVPELISSKQREGERWNSRERDRKKEGEAKYEKNQELSHNICD